MSKIEKSPRFRGARGNIWYTLCKPVPCCSSNWSALYRSCNIGFRLVEVIDEQE